MDSFAENIDGVANLVGSGTNKVNMIDNEDEGIYGQPEDALKLDLSDEELLHMRTMWEGKDPAYRSKVELRQNKNKIYVEGRQRSVKTQDDTPIASNLLFESQETFIPQALSKNPEPVVWSDNTEEGKDASNDIKTMLQYHADVLTLRRKLGVMVRHWSIYFIGIMKHGWDAKIGDINSEIRKPQNFILDPEGYIDEYGNYCGEFLGERIKSSAKELIEMFPEHKEYITADVDNKLGTQVVRTEWWTDEFCFTTYKEKMLDKHKNEFFNYDSEDTDEDGTVTATPGQNHFARPKMPYTFLSVFSLQERPYDVTSLIEQNLSNQDRISDRDEQIDRNLRAGNNSIVVSGISFNQETASQAARAMEQGDPILVPDGQVDSAIKRMPANDLPSALFNSLQTDKDTLRSVFGTNGLSAQQNPEQTARGMILNQSHDSTRIGGGIGDALEQVADNIFNYWLQMYYVFYDETHYASVMGSGRAVSYVELLMSDHARKFVVSVSPNSMQPKDEISEQNSAIELANTGWLDPITLFKKLNYPDPMETAKMVTLFKINPQMYYQEFFPESQPTQIMNPQGNPPDMAPQQGQVDGSLAAPAASPTLNNVPINSQSLPH